jgi:hypothetical protein
VNYIGRARICHVDDQQQGGKIESMLAAIGVWLLLALAACGAEPAVTRGIDRVEPDGAGAEGPAGGEGGSESSPEADPESPDALPAPDSVISVENARYMAAPEPAPAAVPALPAIVSLTGPPAVTNGGSALLHVTLDPPVPDPAFVVSLAGDAGHHVVAGTDTDADGTYDIRVQVSGAATQASLNVRVAVTTGAETGPYSELTLELIQSGQGDVKITLSFDRTHDLDLYVVEPNGEEVSYMNDASATGGQLDLDSGANCVEGSANSENVYWPPGGAPTGTYRVSVQNFEHCTPGSIDFTVRIARDNVVTLHPGSFADGTAGQRLEVATFSR